jgi:hypothetical protein
VLRGENLSSQGLGLVHLIQLAETGMNNFTKWEAILGFFSCSLSYFDLQSQWHLETSTLYEVGRKIRNFFKVFAQVLLKILNLKMTSFDNAFECDKRTFSALRAHLYLDCIPETPQKLLDDRKKLF